MNHNPQSTNKNKGMLKWMSGITASVGNGGVNRPEDVLLVQKMHNLVV